MEKYAQTVILIVLMDAYGRKTATHVLMTHAHFARLGRIARNALIMLN